jgi:hypothetical protein
MGGVFNTVNLHLYHYAGNNPVKYVDPDGRADDELPTTWTEPVFIFGVTGSATFPLLSAAVTESMYFVPNTDKISASGYSLLFTAFINLAINQNIIPKALLLPITTNLLVENSKDVGFLSELMSSGTGMPFGKDSINKGYSASAGFTIGVMRSMNDLDGFYFDIGGSASFGFIGLGLDSVFNDKGELSGFMGMAGIAAGSSVEGHVRMGFSFRHSLMQGK